MSFRFIVSVENDRLQDLGDSRFVTGYHNLFYSSPPLVEFSTSNERRLASKL